MFFFKPLAAIQFWLVQLLIPETCVMAFELLYLAKYFQNFSYFISKVSKNWWLSHYNCSQEHCLDKGSGSLSFGGLGVVKGSVNSLFKGVKGVHSSVKHCVDAFNFFTNLCCLKRSFLEAFICFNVDMHVFALCFIE